MSDATDIALEVTVTAGRTTGTQLLVHDSPATFGRAPESTVVLDVPTASREHGYFERRAGRWYVANRSPNGLRLGGRKVKNRPAELRGHDEVVIGNQAVMTVRLRHVDDAATVTGPVAEGAADPIHEGKGGRVTRTKLLAGIVLFWIVLFGVLLVLRPMFDSTPAPSGVSGLPVQLLTDTQIDRAIRTPLPDQAVNDLRVAEALSEAEDQYSLRELRTDAPYRALAAYKEALAYSPGSGFADPLDDRRYLDLQKQLGDEVKRRYTDIAGKLKSGRFGAAYAALEELMRYIPDYDLGEASLHRHLQQLRDFARRRGQAAGQIKS